MNELGNSAKCNIESGGNKKRSVLGVHIQYSAHDCNKSKGYVVDKVYCWEKPCPPVVVGVGIGGTFDKAALLAKKALLRSADSSNKNPYYARMEAELMERINALGIGPQGLGGKTTALAVNIETYPTHIAGLPVAVNINCHVTRHQTEVL